VQAAFTTPELKEFGEIHGVDVLLDDEDFVLDAVSTAQLANEKVAARNFEVMQAYRQRQPGARSIQMQFLWSPVEIVGEHGKVTGVVVERNRLVPDGNGGVKGRGYGSASHDCGGVGIALGRLPQCATRRRTV
jgi:ferredoxin--NADP+ reductase